MESSTASGLIVRSVNEMDADAIVGIDERITGRYRPDHWERQITYYIQRDTELALVAELDGTVVGFLFGDLRGWEFGFDEPVGWIEVVGVHPDHSGKGIGRTLGRHLLEAFRQRGAKRVLTLVDTRDDPIASFMKSLGLSRQPFEVYGTEL